MKKETLSEAIGMLDEQLVEKALIPKQNRKYSPAKKAIAAVIVIGISLCTVLGIRQFNKNSVPSTDITSAGPQNDNLHESTLSESQPSGGQPIGGQQVLLGTGTSSNNNTQPSGGQQQQQQSQPSGTTQTKVTASGNNTSSGNNTYDEEKEVKKQKDTVMVSINTQTGKIKKATIRGSAALRLDFIKFLKAHPEVELTYILDYKDRVYNIVLRGDDIVIDERVPYYGPEYLI